MFDPVRQSLIQAFVQHELGCKCPAEVFEQIESSIEQEAASTYQRIGVGGRLLVYFTADSSSQQLSRLMHIGRAERDTHGFNRFRLAVVGEVISAKLEWLPQVEQMDDKAHLHPLTQGQLSHYV